MLDDAVSLETIGGNVSVTEPVVATKCLTSTLAENFIGTYEVTLKNIKCTAHVRQVNR